MKALAGPPHYGQHRIDRFRGHKAVRTAVYKIRGQRSVGIIEDQFVGVLPPLVLDPGIDGVERVESGCTLRRNETGDHGLHSLVEGYGSLSERRETVVGGGTGEHRRYGNGPSVDSDCDSARLDEEGIGSAPVDREAVHVGIGFGYLETELPPLDGGAVDRCALRIVQVDRGAVDHAGNGADEGGGGFRTAGGKQGGGKQNC